MNIQELKNDLQQLGLNDNLNLAALLYLAEMMRKTKYKISILITGPAGAGKSFLVKAVTDLIPAEDLLVISKMTPAALVRCQDLSGKVVYRYENSEGEQFAQYIRQLISEGEVIYPTANMEYRLKGPTTFIETTTNPNVVGIENKSRYFVVGINTSTEARRNIFEIQKELRTVRGFQTNAVMAGIQRKHKEFQKNLDPSIEVVISFAKEIAFRSYAQHGSRILDRVLNVISAIAFLQQGERNIIEAEGHRYIEATEDDFYTAKTILQELPIDESEAVVPEETIAFIEILRCHREKLNQLSTFTRGHIFDIVSNSDYPHKSMKVVIKQLAILSEIGYIDIHPVRGLKNRCEYKFGVAFPTLPSEKLLRNCYATLSLAKPSLG